MKILYPNTSALKKVREFLVSCGYQFKIKKTSAGFLVTILS